MYWIVNTSRGTQNKHIDENNKKPSPNENYSKLKLFHVSQNSHQNLYFLLQFYSLQHNSTSKSQLLTMKQSSFYDTRKKAKQKLCPKILANKKKQRVREIRLSRE